MDFGDSVETPGLDISAYWNVDVVPVTCLFPNRLFSWTATTTKQLLVATR